MTCLFWNCRGAGNDDFKIMMTDIHREHEPEAVVILETKVLFSNLGNLFEEFGLSSSAISNPVGKIGGI